MLLMTNAMDAMFTPHDVKLVWRTQDAEQMIVRTARVSAPKNAEEYEHRPQALALSHQT